jgi:succinate dehydrogenase / fumarate reductase, cytochrome b subunit
VWNRILPPLADITGQSQATAIRSGAVGDVEVFITKDLYKETRESFHEGWLVGFYVFSMLIIALHLWHGFASAFQTLGLNHPRWNPLIQGLGLGYSILIPAAFALIPLYVYFTK